MGIYFLSRFRLGEYVLGFMGLGNKRRKRGFGDIRGYVFDFVGFGGKGVLMFWVSWILAYVEVCFCFIASGKQGKIFLFNRFGQIRRT